MKTNLYRIDLVDEARGVGPIDYTYLIVTTSLERALSVAKSKRPDATIVKAETQCSVDLVDADEVRS